MGIRQSALQRLRKSSISAKDIASQAWCEKQMELYIISPMQTAAMQKGAAFHEVRKEEIFVPLKIEPVTYSDRFYKTAYENYTSLVSLRQKGFCRELKLYGSLSGFKVSGQVDELRLEDGKVMVVEDKTVYSSATQISSKIKADSIQVSLYRKMLEEIRDRKYTFDNFANSFALDGMIMSKSFIEGLKSAGIRDELQTMRAMCKKMFEEISALPELSEVLELRYYDRQNKQMITDMKINYDRQGLDEWIQYAMKYWSGEREAQPVSESENWKCRPCRFFGKECNTWWKGPQAK